MLQKLVEEGKITQAQADEYTAWLESRPDIPELKDAFREDREGKRQAALDDWLNKLVDEGKITQAQADEFEAWTQARPDNIPPVGPQMLPKLVEEGIINKAQADEYTKWLESKPDIPLPRPHRGHKGPNKTF